MVEKRKVPCVIGGCWPGEAGGGLTRASNVIGKGSIFDLLWLVLSLEAGTKIREAVINQVLASWGELLQKLLFKLPGL